MSAATGQQPTTTVLVVDGTGRGHAICDLFTRTDPGTVVYYGPGSPIIRHERILPAPSVSLLDPRSAVDFLAEHPVDFVFVSNIDALSRGYADVLRAFGHRVIGPSMAAAALESSKDRGKRFCLDHGIPTAAYGAFTDAESARQYIRSLPYTCVVKTDELTPNGDGAIVCDDEAQALAAVDRFAAECGDRFRVVVEQRLIGPELSVFALLDGEDYLLFPTAMDYKRSVEGDLGGNCDGMGSISPHPFAGEGLERQIRSVLLEPLVRGLRADRLDFTGFIYLGCMITDSGLKVIEINARFGDSEAEVVLPSIRSDFGALCRAVLDRRLGERTLEVDGLSRCSVALTQGCLDPVDPYALPGWPFGAFSGGQPVHGLDSAPGADAAGTLLYYANLGLDEAGTPVTTGGRVLHVVGSGESPDAARDAAYRRIEDISFPGMRYRTDIGAIPAMSVLI